jgi:hypothetical protein
MPPISRTAWRLLALAGLAALVWVCLRLVLPRAAPLQTTRVTELRPPVRDLVDLRAHPGAGGVVELTGASPSFVVPTSPAPRGMREPAIRSLAFRFRLLRPLDVRPFMLFVTPAARPPLAATPVYVDQYRGIVRQDGADVKVTWHLPVAAASCRVRLAVPTFSLLGFDLPAEPGPLFRFVQIDVTEEASTPRWEDAPGSPLLLGRTLAAALLLAIVLLGVGWVWPAARLTSGRARGLLVGMVGLSGVAMLCLFPPFQGPDEYLHWMTGLSWFRPDAGGEPALFNLSETLEARRVAFRPDRPFPPQALHAPPSAEGLQREDWVVHYATPVTYPAVGVVSLLFPHVETTSEALLFYYLCRALPLAVLVGLLALANRAGLMGYTALTFLASPLLLQQTVIITSDTLPNLGTVAACVLWAARLRRPDGRLTTALVAVCLATVAAKPPVYAGLLLLPLFFLPWRRVPYLKTGLAVVTAATLAAVWALGRGGVRAAATLTDPDQLKDFLDRCRGLVEGSAGLIEWFRPLGWLDTGLSERHEALIYASVAAGLALDLVTLGPGLARGLLRTPGRAAALACTLLVNTAGAFLGMCFVMYVTYDHSGAGGIYGIQQRYFFPPLIAALLLPPALAAPPPDGGRGGGAPARAAAAVGLALMAVLLLARHVELIGDLLTRYW